MKRELWIRILDTLSQAYFWRLSSVRNALDPRVRQDAQLLPQAHKVPVHLAQRDGRVSPHPPILPAADVKPVRMDADFLASRAAHA